MQAKLMDQKDFREYTKKFIQRQPRYAVKQIGGKAWKTKNKPLSDIPIKAHLNGQYYVGVLGKWYPGFTILDIDDKDIDTAEEIREGLKLDTNNSMLLTSESDNSYHILFRPSYNNRPPTIRLLNEILKPFANEKGIEIYPQANKAIRLPFGHRQNNLDFEYINLNTWSDKLYWFNKLDDLDLKTVPQQQLRLDLNIKPDKSPKTSIYEEGKFLYKTGLIETHSRNDSQWKVLYYIWRQNIPLITAIDMTWQWIKTKHNNNSQEIKASPQKVKNEIERQAKRIYENYEFKLFYPDEIHNAYNGYITKADIEDIFYIAKAGLPMAKFLFNLVKYCYPRQDRTFIQLHSDILITWSQRGYQKQLDDLQKLRIIKRYGSYQVDNFAKSIKVEWDFRDTSQAILIDNRAPEDLTDTIKACYKPEEFRELLLKAGSKRVNAINATKRIFKGVTNV
jgi:hypothetical protein